MPIIIEAPKPLVRMSISIPKELRVVFFGTPSIAVPSLRRLHEDGWPIAMVVTAPDQPVGRRQVLTPSPVKTLSEQLDIPVRTPETLKDDVFWQEFTDARPDLCIVVAYGKIIPQRFLEVPRLGFVNVHPSLLPAYRGPSPIQTAILDGCASTGVSIMLVDEEVDHGPVLAMESWAIPSGFDAPTCTDELARIGANLLAQTLPGYTEGTVVPMPQNHSLATFTKKFQRADGRLDWSLSAQKVADRIRALSENPGTWTTWQGKTLNILEASVAVGPAPSPVPGTVHLQNAGMIVSCGREALILDTVQLEGSTKMPSADFARGRPIVAGTVLI